MARRSRKPPTPPPPPEAALAARLLTDEQEAELHRLMGDRVKQARLELGLTQEQLGHALGRTQPWAREVESGRTAPRPFVLLALAGATGHSLGWFYGVPDRTGPAE